MSENRKRKMVKEKPTNTAMKMTKREITSGPQSALRAAKGLPRSPELQQLYDKAAELEENENFNEALEVVDEILFQEEKRLALPAKLSELKMKLEKMINANRSWNNAYKDLKYISKNCQDMFWLIEALTVSEGLQESIDCEECDSKLHDIINLVRRMSIKYSNLKSEEFLLMLSCRLNLILNFFIGKDRLEKLFSLCSLMLPGPLPSIFDDEIERLCFYDKMSSFVDKIFAEFEKIKEIGKKEAVEKRAWLLYHYGKFAFDNSKFTKAESVYTEGINLMKKTFGNDAPKYRVFGYLHKHRIFALSKSSTEAASKSKLWKEVIDMFKQATDWESKDERFKRLGEAAKEFKMCSEKLDKISCDKFSPRHDKYDFIF